MKVRCTGLDFRTCVCSLLPRFPFFPCRAPRLEKVGLRMLAAACLPGSSLLAMALTTSSAGSLAPCAGVGCEPACCAIFSFAKTKTKKVGASWQSSCRIPNTCIYLLLLLRPRTQLLRSFLAPRGRSLALAPPGLGARTFSLRPFLIAQDSAAGGGMPSRIFSAGDGPHDIFRGIPGSLC